jgi:hypothetical protein
MCRWLSCSGLGSSPGISLQMDMLTSASVGSCLNAYANIQTGFNCGCLMHFKVMVWCCAVFFFMFDCDN